MSDGSGFQVGDDAAAHYDQQVRVFMAPFVEALVKSVVDPGESVLDVACGTGFATRAAATAVGDTGRVSGADINSGMIAQAQAANPDLVFYEASALDLPFGDDEFDAVICQQGVQFFPDPAAGLAEMARVGTRRLGMTVWAAAELCPYPQAQSAMRDRFLEAPPLAATVEGGEEEILGWFRHAGLAEVSIERIDRTVSLPPVREYVPRHIKALPHAPAFFALSDTARTEALAFLEDRLSAHVTEDGMNIPFSSYLAIADL